MKYLKYIFILAGVLILGGGYVIASTTFMVPTQIANSYQNFTFFNATSTNATSTNLTGGGGYFTVAGAKKVSLYMSRGDTTGQGNSGSSNFSVQISPDGTNWYNYNKLIQNLATSTEQTTLSSITIGAGTSTTIVSLDNNLDAFYAIRCIVVETTDGEHTCKASAEF